MSLPDPQPEFPGPDQGPGGSLVNDRLIDVAQSVPDPSIDLRLPSLRLAEWKQIRASEDVSEEKLLASAIAIESYLEAHHAGARNNDPKRLFARQQSPDQSFLEKLEAGLREIVASGITRANPELMIKATPFVEAIRKTVVGNRPEKFMDLAGRRPPRGPLDFDDMLRQSVAIFQALKERFLKGRELEKTVDLRAAWYGVRDQLDTSGCVGWAVGDLLWRQREGRMDVPSARYIWQAAKEMDGDDRPTTMIAGAGTSLRAALQAVRDHGFALEAEIPSSTNDLYSGSIQQFYETVGPRAITDFVNLGRDMKMLIAWLSLRRPVVCSVVAGLNFVNTRGQDAVIQPDGPNADRFRHALVIVGYRVGAMVGGKFESLGEGELRRTIEDIEKLDKAPERQRSYDELPIQYLVRNTAGLDWGDRGYAWMNNRDLAYQLGECYGVFCSTADFKRLVPKPPQRPTKDVPNPYGT